MSRVRWLGVVAALLAASGCTPGAPSSGDGRTESQTSLRGQEVRASRSGDLGIEDLPRPRDLGTGWKYRVDLGNPEDGYGGSGEPATARDPKSVLAAITPLGCRPVRLPMPERALEVTYALGAEPAVALALHFSDDVTAGRFFDLHAQVVRECTASRHVDIAVARDADALFVSTRTEQLGETPTWTEGMRLAGDEVTLVAVADSSRGGVRSTLSALS